MEVVGGGGGQVEEIWCGRVVFEEIHFFLLTMQEIFFSVGEWRCPAGAS